MREAVERHHAMAADQGADERAELRKLTTPPVHEVHDRPRTPDAATYGAAKSGHLEGRTALGRLRAAA